MSSETSEKKESKTETPTSYLSDQEKKDAVKTARRNDLRLILGWLFVAYGFIVTLWGILFPAADRAKTGNIAINLWTGVGMLIVGIAFLLWDHFNPLSEHDILVSAEASAKAAAIESETVDTGVTNPSDTTTDKESK